MDTHKETLNSVVHPLDEVIQELVRHITNTELPHSTPVRTHNLANILDTIENGVAVDILAVDVSSVIEMVDCTRRAGNLRFRLGIKLLICRD
jgi:hypothetical protein